MMLNYSWPQLAKRKFLKKNAHYYRINVLSILINTADGGNSCFGGGLILGTPMSDCKSESRSCMPRRA